MFNLILMFTMFSIISMFMLLINTILSSKKINSREKLSPFECGFDPLSSSRLPFSMQFYLIGIIFLIFDIEIIVFLPMIYSYLLGNFHTWSFTCLFFIMILMLGLYMEWKNGALMWLK